MPQRNRPTGLPLEPLEPRRLFAAWQPLHEPGNGGWATSIASNPNNTSQLVLGGDILGVGVSFDRGASWADPSVGLKNWEMGSATFYPGTTRPNELWIGSLNGPYYSGDNGRTWQPRRIGMPAESGGSYSQPIERVLIDRQNPSQLFAFAGNHRILNGMGNTQNLGKIYRSANGGTSWSVLHDLDPNPNDNSGNYPAGRFNIMHAAYAANGNTIFVAVDERGLYRFSDTSPTTAPVPLSSGLPASPDVQFVVTHPTNSNILWVGLGNGQGVYKSVNGGSTFTPSNGAGSTALPTATNGLDPNASYKAMAVQSSNGNILYVGNENFASGQAGVFRSSNGGFSWQRVMGDGTNNFPRTQPAGPSTTYLHVDAANRVYAVNSDNLFASDNAGQVWTEVMNTTPANAPAGALRGRGFAGWVAWDVSPNPYLAGHISFQAMDAGNQWTSFDDGYSWRRQQGLDTYNGGRAVAYTKPDANGNFTTVGVFGQQWSGAYSVAKSLDGGLTWARFNNFPYAAGAPTDIHIDPDDPNQIWVVSDGKIYRSPDGGLWWGEIAVGVDPAFGRITADPFQSRRVENGNVVYDNIYITGRDGVYELGHNGWFVTAIAGSPVQVGPNESGSFTHVAIDPADPSRIYVANWRSNDNGGLHRYSPSTGWTRISSDSLIAASAVDPQNPDRLFLITNDHQYHDSSYASGVYYTTSARFLAAPTPAAWTQFNAGLSHLAGEVITFDPSSPQRLIIGTSGRGYYTTNVAPSAPFSTLPVLSRTISTRIEAEDYDTGGRNIAFADADPSNNGNAHRQDAVDIRPVLSGGSNFQVGWTAPDEFLTYTVNVAETGFYTLRLRVTSPVATGRVHIQANGLNLTGTVSIPATGSNDSFVDVILPNLRLAAGTQRLSLQIDSGGFDIDSLTFSATAVTRAASQRPIFARPPAPPPPPVSASAKVQALLPATREWRVSLFSNSAGDSTAN